MLTETEKEIRNMTLEEAYRWIKIENVEKDILNKVKLGININFNINEYLQGIIKVDGKSRVVIIGTNAFTTSAFFNEIEEREKIMKNWLIQRFGNDGIYGDEE